MISVSGVSMRFGSKVLFEDVTTTFSAGRRYGLTGPNGAGKSTFMKLLTGELEPQRGTVVRPRKARRAAPGSLRVRPVPRHRHRDHGQPAALEALAERDALYARADMSNEDGMRLGELEGIVGEEDGYSAESDAAVLLQGLDIPDALHERTMAELQGGQKVRVLLAQALYGQPQALLLDEPTNHLDLDSIHWLQQFLSRYDGTLDRHLARSALPERHLHAHRRHRLRDDHHLYRRLRRHGGGQDADSDDDRSRERAAREEDRAAERLHRPLRRRHARQPGDVAAQGSRAAADDRAGAVEHSAPVHQVHDAPAVGQSGPGMRGPHQGAWRHAGHLRIRRHRQPRRPDRARRTQRRRQDDAAEGAAGRRARHAAVARRSSTRARCAGATRCRSATSRRTTPARSRRG